MQDLQEVAEENAILMRECAMASLSALQSLESADEGELDELVTPHPEMLPGEDPVSIPDTAAAFLKSLGGASERFQNRPAEDAVPGTPPPESDRPRPGALRHLPLSASLGSVSVHTISLLVFRVFCTLANTPGSQLFGLFIDVHAWAVQRCDGTRRGGRCLQGWMT